MTVRRGPVSLRLRVTAAAALGTALVVLLLGGVAWVGIDRQVTAQLDAKLDSVTQVTAADLTSLRVLEGPLPLPPDYAGTLRVGELVLSTTAAALPPAPEGWSDATVDGTQYRVRTVEVISGLGATISVGAPIAPARSTISGLHRWTVVIGFAAVLVAAALGWLFAGVAVRPLRRLAEQTRRLGVDPAAPPPRVSGAKEAAELAAALRQLLDANADERARRESALETARDFAAASAHELRTPLTAMRTNLEVAATLDLSPATRQEVLADALRTQRRVEATLRALERLAAGELSSGADFVPVDLAELLDRAAQDAARSYGGVTVRLDVPATLTVTGLPAGLRLAVDNAVSNAIRHGGAHVIEIAARDGRDAVVVTVSDDGTGVPVGDREVLFERFRRGAGAAPDGSGLGLALIRQQAQLHGGAAWFEDSPLGGVRLVLRLPRAAS
ncbi:HAMP domain-containing histidine kinase [Rhodococcus spelaei]|uniref:histidine kinase n=1 Tax=Rhodococcus spelaei TaxID=2546320 RepID=A0A541B7S9_9NOCA|nr:HAMP domain-containing sensor histidine kinase [Rhodococcus spelaei]TQF68353.1 HAMP domain-containing histidine kinase [Rhodococcus spelaei]